MQVRVHRGTIFCSWTWRQCTKRPAWVFKASSVHSFVCTCTGSQQVRLLDWHTATCRQWEREAKSLCSGWGRAFLSAVEVARWAFRCQRRRGWQVEMTSYVDGEWWEWFATREWPAPSTVGSHSLLSSGVWATWSLDQPSRTSDFLF